MLRSFEERPDDGRGGAARPEVVGRAASDDRSPAILCASCRRRVTSAAARIEVMGLHEHTCTNPGGFIFRIGCFADAAGVEVVSNPSSEWSWFPGWRWQIEECGGCGTHLGWRYVRQDAQFHAFILDRLVEEPSDPGNPARAG